MEFEQNSLDLVDQLHANQRRVKALATVLLDRFEQSRGRLGDVLTNDSAELCSLIQDIADESSEINTKLWRRLHAFESASA